MNGKLVRNITAIIAVVDAIIFSYLVYTNASFERQVIVGIFYLSALLIFVTFDIKEDIKKWNN